MSDPQNIWHKIFEQIHKQPFIGEKEQLKKESKVQTK